MYCTPWEISQYTKLYLLARGEKNLRCFFGRCEEERRLRHGDVKLHPRDFFAENGTSTSTREGRRRYGVTRDNGMRGIWGRERWSRELKRVKVQTEYTNEKRSIDGGEKPRMHGTCARGERERKRSCLYSKERWQRDSERARERAERKEKGPRERSTRSTWGWTLCAFECGT